MVRAWYIDNNGNNPKAENHRLPPQFISLEDLYSLTGVEHYEFDINSYQTELTKWRKERNLESETTVVITADLAQDYYTEHLHEDDEIQFVLEGCCYYDIRDPKEEWIRLEILPGDCILVPKGCYHRFTLDEKNLYKAKQFFTNDSNFNSHYRPADNLKCRKEYHKQQKEGFKVKS